MYILSSAIKNIRRYAGRYVLFGILFLAVLGVGATSLTVADTIDAEVDRLLQEYGASVYIIANKGALSSSDYAPFSTFPQVSEIVDTRFTFDIYHDVIRVNDKDIDLANLHGEEGRNTLHNRIKGGYVNTPTISVLGIDFDADPFFNRKTGAESLTVGRLPETDKEALLTCSFCETAWGELPALGSTLSLTFDGIEQQFTIVGLLESCHFTSDDFLSIKREPQIILTFPAANEFRQNGALEAYYQYVFPLFVSRHMGETGFDIQISDQLYSLERRTQYQTFLRLHDYTLYDAFSSRVEAYGKETDTEYAVRFTTRGAANLIKAYESTAQICTFFLTAVIATSAAVILIMTALAMHERRYEIGVLLSVGMSKPRIALLFAVENLIFTLAVTALAYAVGLIAAPAAADKLLEGVVTISRAAAALPVAARMLALAVGLSLPASLISSLAILRYKPMTILRSRS